MSIGNSGNKPASDRLGKKGEIQFLEFDSPIYRCYSSDKQFLGENMLRNVPSIRLRILLALFLVSILVGAQKIETVNGVRVIHNEKGGKWGANPEVKLELVRTIGGLDAEENLSFNNPNDIVRDSHGNLYILDTDNNRIQKLDSEGKFIKTIGRKGQGPGEFQRAQSMDIDKKDNIFVFDSGNARIQIISPEGRPLKSFKLLFSVAGRIRLLKSDLIVKDGAFYYSVRIERPKKLPKLLEIIDQNGRTKLAFGEAMDYKDADINSWANFVKYDTDAEKNIYLSFDRQNRIEKYAPDGTLLWRADRQLDYGTGYVKGGTKQGMPMNVVSRGIAADGKGRIWVITVRRQMTQEERGKRISAGGVTLTRIIAEPKIEKMDIYKLEIFSPEGVLLGEILLNHLAGDIRIFGDTLYLWEYSNTTFYQYKIIENESH